MKRTIRNIYWFVVGLALSLTIPWLFAAPAFPQSLGFGGDLSFGVVGGTISQAHSECDKNHCLDGGYLIGATLDYELLDSEYFTFRPGLALYRLEYRQSYRDDANSPRQNTRGVSTDVLAGVVRGGVKLFDRISPYGIIGYGNTTVFGYGVTVRVTDNLHLDAESLHFDDNCDQFSAYVGGLRYNF